MNRKTIIAGLMLATLVVATLGLNATVKAAADVNQDFACSLGPLGVTFDSHQVINNNKNGNAVLVCKGHTDLNTTGRAVVLTDLGCNTGGGFTSDGHMTVSASGNATLVCSIHN